MDKREYYKLLEEPAGDRNRKQAWDIRAKEFFGYSKGSQDGAIMAFLKDHMEIAGKRILDIGCGSGRFLIPFVKLGAKVTGIDISSEMLKQAVRLAEEEGIDPASYQLHKIGWDEFDPDPEGYDLVFASMSPGISDWKSIEKALHTTREGLYISSFAHRREPLFDHMRQLYKSAPPKDWQSRFRGMINLLMLEGYFPDVKFLTRRTDSETDPEKLALKMAPRLVEGIVTQEKLQEIEGIIREELARNGNVNPTERIVGMLYVDTRLRRGIL